jgi:hypothetical protein
MAAFIALPIVTVAAVIVLIRKLGAWAASASTFHRSERKSDKRNNATL